jgi:type I restriction enzyme M protein
MAHNLSGIIKSIRDIMREDRGINGDAQRIEQLGWMLFLKIFDDKDQELELIHEDYHSPIPAELQWRAWAANAEGITGDELLNFVDRTLFPALRELNPQRGGSVDARALMVREVFEGNNNYMKSGVNLRKIINKLSEIDFNASEDRHLFGDLYEGILRELQSAGDSGEFYTPRAVTQFMTEMLNPQLGETVLDPACGTGGFLVCTVEHLKQQVRTPDERLRLQETVRGMEYKPLPFVLALTNLILHDVELPRIEYGDSLARQYDGIRERDRVNVILANPPFGGTVANGNETNFPANFRTKESADLFLVLIMQLLKQGGRAALVLPDGSLTGDGVKQRVRQKLLEECNLHTIVRLPNSVFQPYATVATNLLFFEKGTPTKEVWYYEHRLPEGQKSYSKTKTIQVREFEPIRAWWKDANPTKRVESDVAWRVSVETLKERGYDLDVKNPTKLSDDTEHTSAELAAMLAASMRKGASLLDELVKELQA